MQCFITKRGLTSRLYCYDIDFPMILKYPQYECHGHKFNILNKNTISLLPSNVETNISLLIFDKLVMVKKSNIDINNSDSKISTFYNCFIQGNIKYFIDKKTFDAFMVIKS